MLIVPPPKFRRNRGRVKARPGPVLTGATYNSSGLYVQLTFDRAVNAGGLMGAQIRVDDQPGGSWCLGTGGVIVLTANSIGVSPVLGGSTSGSADLLNVGAVKEI